MKDFRPCILSLTFAFAAVAMADVLPTYTLGIPKQAGPMRDTSIASSNAWLKANPGFVPSSGWMSGNVAKTSNDASVMTGETLILGKTEVGFPWERLKPEYYRSDRLRSPDGVDWYATYTNYQAAAEKAGKGEDSGFIFNPDPQDPCVYVTDGGLQTFTWVFTNGTSRTDTYVVGTTCSGRPRRIFWTDSPYNGSPVSLSGKFVKLFGNKALTTVVTGPKEVVSGGVIMTNETAVLRGLYIDKTAQMLYAAGELSGQCVMAYYETGDYLKILHVQVIEVSRPVANSLTGTIGTALKPDGGGYPTEGLVPYITAGTGNSEDDRGDYLYQHAGNHSYSPKNKDVFPIRPTVGKRWKAEICWKETDAMGVIWPFEIDQYTCNWPKSGHLYVRGDMLGDTGAKIYLPSVYTVELQKFQEPDGHARDVSGNVFYTTGEGWSLLKLTADDNIWFMPIHSILRSDGNYFTLESANILVGEEFLIRGGAQSGIAKDQKEVVDATDWAPGYIYKATSGTQYDANLYYETTNATADAATTVSTSTTTTLPSAIFAINTTGEANANEKIEVWWSRRVMEEDMPAWIDIPALPQVYRPVWPNADQAPTIVLASQEGSKNKYLNPRHGAARFDTTNAVMRLAEKQYFSDEGGTIAFWTCDDLASRKTNAVRNVETLMTFGNETNSTLRFVFDYFYRSERKAWTATCNVYWGDAFILSANDPIVTPVPTDAQRDGTSWTHVAMTYSRTNAVLYVNGSQVAVNNNAADVARTASALSGALIDATIGKSSFRHQNVFPVRSGRRVAELAIWDYLLSATEITNAMYFAENHRLERLTGYYSFRRGEDLTSETQSSVGTGDVRYFFERVGMELCNSTDVSLATPGAPSWTSCIIESDTTPTIYVQNDATKVGYNPNEEHAIVTSGDDGYIAWALRSDLNTSGSSRPGVFVEYSKNGYARMQFLHVVATNAVWPRLEADWTAGLQLPGPKPLTTFEDPWLAQDYWDKTSGNTPGVAYRDRKLQCWARAAGDLAFRKYYRMQDGFYFPQFDANHQPAVGTAIPWLARFDNPNADVLTGKPAVWTWHVAWPKTVEVMKIGQTLIEASGGLPGVWDMKSLSVVHPDPNVATDTVILADPTVMRSVAFKYSDLKTLGLTAEPGGGLSLRSGKYTFTDAPPHLSSRLYLDTTCDKLCLVGKYEQKNAGASVLYPNVLTSTDRQKVINLVKSEYATKSDTKATYTAWVNAVNALAVKPLQPNTMKTVDSEIFTQYANRDHYSLTSVGGTGYVVLIENDAPTTNTTYVTGSVTNSVKMGVADGDPIQMHVFFVTNQYYTGRIVTRQDENNLLSQQLSVLYTEPFAGDAENYVFEWRSADPNADGTIPDAYDDTQVYKQRTHYGSVQTNMLAGATTIVVGEQGDTLANMVNKYWICRYRAKDATCPAHKTMGLAWSAWCAPPALADGWVQRVLNNVTPFNQLMTDLYNNQAETAISMIKKAGKPYQGDVALNQDALTSKGLIELYETIFNKAESMSLLLNDGQEGVCKQLMLCAERLDDLYTVLGDEAYSDAKNPTIGFGSTTTFDGTVQTEVDFGSASSALFCFDNQVRSLLDEELALLRGRTGASAPVMTTAPYYNRLLWNFTKGITAGEVAYAVNYNIEGSETVALSEEQAAALYPQGHGDAYGHYLSALKGWYRLLRNPVFSWQRAQGEMTVADSSVNVDYYEEQKFVKAAYNLAKTAADVVDLTARQAWGDTDDESSGYMDSVTNRAFGSGEWANRGAYGALVNWAVGNSLLPKSSTVSLSDDTYTDSGLTRIDRGTVTELASLVTQAKAIQAAEDRVDGGFNPLGLSDSAIPFDITPIGANDGTKTHYEQIRERAGTAMENARKVLDRAQEYSNRLRMIQETQDSYEDMIATVEANYKVQLINYYGKPYSDDIGPSGTYPQGYDGPDLYHYMWMDLEKFGLSSLDTLSYTAKTYSNTSFDSVTYAYMIANWGTKEWNITYDYSASGIVVKPSTISGTRPMQGSIQEKYAEFLNQLVKVQQAQASYKGSEDLLTAAKRHCKDIMGLYSVLTALKEFKAAADVAASIGKASNTALMETLDACGYTTKKVGESSYKTIPSVLGAGLSVVTSPQSLVEGVQSIMRAPTDVTEKMQIARLKIENEYIDTIIDGYASVISAYEATISMYETSYSCVTELKSALSDVASAANTLKNEVLALQTCLEAYKSEIAKAEQVLEAREADRQVWVNKMSQSRYNDMFFRQLRNQALSRYTASFDLAQKYVYEAAKAYDYETALLSSDEASGDNFLRQIVASRSLGSFADDGTPLVGDVGDTGLAGLLAQMDANWLVLKPRLGINNPQEYATWFSLRRECFRILPDDTGDNAWAKELTKYWVDDITSNADFQRYCQPFQSQFGLKEKEPGLIIPFETTIDFAKNLFGQDLAGGDSTYDSTWYATRIYSAGLWFDGYNSKASGYKGTELLSKTPVAYLVPMGKDCMRVPGLDDGTYLSWNVIDQVIAAPYSIGSTHLDDTSWYPSASEGDLGGADSTTKIRKHPSFRAYYDTTGGEPTDNRLDCTRLVGRSAWNTKWMLVIPAGGMNADRDKALSVFINGSDVNRDGKLDILPVSDIRIGFRTYSNSGN